MRSDLLCCRHVNKTFALITVGQRKLLRNDLGRELQHCKIILKIISTVLIEHLQLGYPFILCHSYFFKFIKRTNLKKFPAKKIVFKIHPRKKVYTNEMTSASMVLSLFYIRIADIYTLGRKTNLLKKNINFNSELIDILIWKELLVVKINTTTMF